MPNLATSLRTFELDQLQQIALLWGLEPEAADKPSLLLTLELNIPERERFSIVFEQLPDPAQHALFELKRKEGKLPWSTFAQRFGEIRALGKTLRKKEQPWSFPASISETLWYHSLLGRDFLRVEGDLQEMAYLPDELLPLLPAVPDQQVKLTLEPLSQDVNVEENLGNSEILDEACLFLAAMRFDKPQSYLAKTTVPSSTWNLLESLLLGVGILDEAKQPTDLARKFLELPRAQALGWLANQWLKSSTFHEIDHLPGLQIESATPIRSQAARQTIVDILSHVQTGRWYSLDDLIVQLKSTNPDFLRQQEEYFSWTILKDSDLQEPLSGYESWFQVEGTLIGFIVTQLLTWLGLADSGTSEETPARKLFRLNESFFSLESPMPPVELESQDAPIALSSTGKIITTNRSPRLVRYQLSRFVDWLEVSPSKGSYQITPNSLAKAKEQGLLPKHLIQLLRKHAENGLPPILYEAIKRWDADGTQASIQTQTVLRLGSPEILQAIRESPAAHWLGESLGPTTVIIKPNGEKAILQALSGLGYLCEYNESESNNA